MPKIDKIPFIVTDVSGDLYAFTGIPYALNVKAQHRDDTIEFHARKQQQPYVGETVTVSIEWGEDE